VLLMAYGTPEREEDILPYYTHIRHGRPPSAEQLQNLTERYRTVGGRTPLRDLTDDVARAVEAELAARGAPRPVYVGMKHWHPYIADTVRRMANDGVRDVTALVLAPHYSRMSIGQYRGYFDKANAELAQPMTVRFIESWHAQPEFEAMMAGLVSRALEQFPAERRDAVLVVFTAHSLPVKIREWGDPYERELLDSSRAVAERLGRRDWRFAWQSAGQTGEPWIGPDIQDYLETLHAEGVQDVLQVPIGFVAEHLEVLYDIDIEAKQKAASLGMRLERTELPNARPEFIAAVVGALTAEG
ncbi:MAG TPA: ferrochelatase, partial [Gemmatimonadaceae bacterium]|nr:ferrochelatase [Gemmatimonadaceae bacterium]